MESSNVVVGVEIDKLLEIESIQKSIYHINLEVFIKIYILF